MKVVFVALGQEQLGISILSAVLREAGHDTALVFDPALFHDRYYFDVPVLRDLFARGDDLIDELVAEKPDLIAFSVLTPTYTWCVSVAERAKARLGEVPVIFGGVHPSAVPAICLENECVDYVCVGEGEEAILALCEELEKGVKRPARPLGNLWWKDEAGEIVQGPALPFRQDLDALPFWDKALWEDVVRIKDNYLTMTSRGCPYRCTFCFNNFFAKLPGKGGGKYVRHRSVERCMDELLQAKARYGIEHVDFTDDIFTLDKPWLKRFLERYQREIGVPFCCLVHPRYIDHEMASWLKDAGCDRIQLGIQSADEEYKRRQLLRMEKDTHLQRALDALSSAGLPMKLDHILGLPEEPLEAQEMARKLFVKYTPARINTYWLSHLPGVEITRDAHAAGVISDAEMDAINRGKTRLFHHLDHWKKDEHFDYYQRYDVLFRLFPLLPRAARERLRAEHLPTLPPRVANAVGFLADLTAALVQNDSDTWIYGKHYAFHVARALPELLLGDAAPKRDKPRRAPPPKRPRPEPAQGRSLRVLS